MPNLFVPRSINVVCTDTVCNITFSEHETSGRSVMETPDRLTATVPYRNFEHGRRELQDVIDFSECVQSYDGLNWMQIALAEHGVHMDGYAQFGHTFTPVIPSHMYDSDVFDENAKIRFNGYACYISRETGPYIRQQTTYWNNGKIETENTTGTEESLLAVCPESKDALDRITYTLLPDRIVRGYMDGLCHAVTYLELAKRAVAKGIESQILTLLCPEIMVCR